MLAPMASFAVRPAALGGGAGGAAWRRLVTRRVLAERPRRCAHPAPTVTLLGPGPEDLQAIGANLMDPGAGSEVLATSLRTSAEALRRRDGGRMALRTGTAS